MAIQKENYETLFTLITQSNYCVAFTGAGISTLSGIRDFRGKKGLYTQPNSEKMFDLDLFYKDPSFFYSAAQDFIYNLEDKKPSIVHISLARLEKKGILKAVITQNIDLLHQKAGSLSVIELHGSPAIHSCTKCSYSTTFDAVVKTAHKGAVPLCPQCRAPLKPNITFFGENLPIKALNDAEKECAKADLLLILGSSLVVYPAAALPEITLQANGRLVIINNQPTHLDRSASLCFTDLEETFTALKEM